MFGRRRACCAVLLAALPDPNIGAGQITDVPMATRAPGAHPEEALALFSPSRSAGSVITIRASW